MLPNLLIFEKHKNDKGDVNMWYDKIPQRIEIYNFSMRWIIMK